MLYGNNSILIDSILFLKLKQNFRFIFPRIFIGAVLLILFGNNLLPLVAMTLQPVGECQMACCRGFHRHKKNSSADSCPLMNEENGSREMMTMEEMPDEKNGISKKHEIKNFDFSVTQPKIPVYYHETETNSDDNQKIPFLNIRFIGGCDGTTCGASGFSGVGKRGQQSSDNSVLLTFADKPRPPTLVSIKFGTRTVSIFKARIHVRHSSSRGPPVFFS